MIDAFIGAIIDLIIYAIIDAIIDAIMDLPNHDRELRVGPHHVQEVNEEPDPAGILRVRRFFDQPTCHQA